MSKSEAYVRGHAVQLLDTSDEIRSTIRRAVTDAGREVRFSDAPEKAGVNNLLEIYQLLTDWSREAVEAHFAGKGYADLKNEVAEVVVVALRPIRSRCLELIGDLAELECLLKLGAGRACNVAEPKIEEIKDKIGFLVSH